MNKSAEQTSLRDIKGKILKKDQIVRILKKPIKTRFSIGTIESTPNNKLYVSIVNETDNSIDLTWKNWNKEVEIIGTLQKNFELISQLFENTISPFFFQILKSKNKKTT